MGEQTLRSPFCSLMADWQNPSHSFSLVAVGMGMDSLLLSYCRVPCCQLCWIRGVRRETMARCTLARIVAEES